MEAKKDAVTTPKEEEADKKNEDPEKPLELTEEVEEKK